MTFKEAFNKCEKNEWQTLVIQSLEYLGPNALITYSSQVDSKGKIISSKGKRFLLIAYKDDDFIEIPGPFDISEDMDNWTAQPFWVNEEEKFDPKKVTINDFYGELEYLRTGKRNKYLLNIDDIDEYFD